MLLEVHRFESAGQLSCIGHAHHYLARFWEQLSSAPSSSDCFMTSQLLEFFTQFSPAHSQCPIDLFRPLRSWIQHRPVTTATTAHRIAKIIPAQCPFERDVILFGQKIFRIPPLCKLNPLYEELVELRFKALCFLADECGEDISAYI